VFKVGDRVLVRKPKELVSDTCQWVGAMDQYHNTTQVIKFFDEEGDIRFRGGVMFYFSPQWCTPLGELGSAIYE